jgi:hypothetical protein
MVEAASIDAAVWYYRCPDCGHVWAIPKNDPHAAPQDITIPDGGNHS